MTAEPTPEALVDALSQAKAAERVDEYLVRGRRLAVLSEEHLRECYTASYKAWAADTVPKQLWLAGAIVWCARIATATKSNGGLHQDLLGPYVRPT